MKTWHFMRIIDSHEMSILYFLWKIEKNQNVICCICDQHFKGTDTDDIVISVSALSCELPYITFIFGHLSSLPYFF